MPVRTKEDDANGVDVGWQQFMQVVPRNPICKNPLDDNLVINVLSNTCFLSQITLWGTSALMWRTQEEVHHSTA